MSVMSKRRGIARSFIATALVVLSGAGVLWWGTDGLSAFTAETARRVDILQAPRPLPATLLEDQDGKLFHLSDYHGRLLAVEFIYTRCSSVCMSLGMAFKQIRDQLPRQALDSDVALLSISFDPQRDDPARMKEYARLFRADGVRWRIARVRDETELESLLKAFGVVVIDDGRGGYEHNAAIHLVGRDGRLREISDLDQIKPFVGRISELL
ncbi:SCO family protein [Sedimenticola sp.]|uniref:SCO family protein n=1 Tax=Sedimenticola sp. TaxID=1940285 RepID=UPI0025844C59|nr:SCO family protein [Sedimenticola sp.]MCW8903353.1 SCO family protein [Sedimenticola sp.]